ncbi:hypothetical protein D3C75_997620 [compost metagenome]
MCQLLSGVVRTVLSPPIRFKLTSGNTVLLDAVGSPPVSAPGLLYVNRKVGVPLPVTQRQRLPENL